MTSKRGRGRPPSGPMGEGREVRVQLTISATEQRALEHIQAIRGDEKPIDTLRALPAVWSEREALYRQALADFVVGKVTMAETGAILEVMNGHGLTALVDRDEHGLPSSAFLGSHLVPNLADSNLGQWAPENDEPKFRGALVEKLAAMPRVARIALELWTIELWNHADDDELWEDERRWLAGEPAPAAEA